MTKKEYKSKRSSDVSLPVCLRGLSEVELWKILEGEERTSTIREVLQSKGKEELIAILADLDRILVDKNLGDVTLARTGPPWNRVALARKLVNDAFERAKGCLKSEDKKHDPE